MHEHDNHPHGQGLSSNQAGLYEELTHHLPFSVSAVAIGLAVAGIICFLAPVQQIPVSNTDLTKHTLTEGASHAHSHSTSHSVSGRDSHDHESCEHDSHDHENAFLSLFHVFHPVHMLFSAAATTAMFWRYERRVLKALIIGLIGAIGVCGLSDIVMPHISLMLLGKHTPWHICAIENPRMVLSFAAVGVAVGLVASKGVRHSTFFSHSLHVFSSSMASIFYLIGPFGRLGWTDSVGTIFLFIIVAVMVPCCLSDIVFPLLLAKGAHRQYRNEHVSCGC